MSKIETHLKELNITLPEILTPVANYVSYTYTPPYVFTSGQLSTGSEGLVTGKMGKDKTEQEGYEAARLCGYNLIAILKKACLGDLDRLDQIIKITGFVNVTPDFTNIPQIINGCSDLMVEVFGEKGRHARSAVSAPSLPLGALVEIEAIFKIKP